MKSASRSARSASSSGLASTQGLARAGVARSNRFLVWGSIVLIWMLSLLPWRLWSMSPDVLMLVIAFWCVKEPRQIGLSVAFLFGFFMDVHDAGPLGEHALAYVIVAYGAMALRRRLQRFALWQQALHLLPVFIGARALTHVIHSLLAGQWGDWHWLVGASLSVLLWPVVGGLLGFAHEMRHDGEPVV